MSALFGFIVGYVVGARAGSPGFARVEQAVRDIRNSDEFRGLLEAVQIHAKETMQILNDRLQSDGPTLPELDDLASQARARLSGWSGRD